MTAAIAFAFLSLHAKMHHRLDTFDSKYRRLLQDIETREIRAFDNEKKYGELEALKQELLSIRFLEEKKKEQDLTGPSP